jgi:predicted ATPase
VGRVRELEDAKRMLSDSETRLLTLGGPGGCGKTRLALRVARGLEGSFSDGVWWVELASLFEPGLVPQRVARTLGVSQDPGPPLVELIFSYLGSKKALLVLDNCEHLIEACAELAENVLRACQAVSIITSREALRIPGEVVRLVPPLSLPDPDHRPTLEELNKTEAARLFYERASAASSGYVLGEEDAPALALLCRRLDGISLALELAAARVGMLTIGQITDRLEDRFGLLTRSGRTAPPRQQTLRATMDWGYDLLSDAERVLFGRLSVFAGGFSLEEVEEVCAGDGIEQWEVLDLLSSLADKSLVLAREQGGAVRYRMLQTVRRYAGEKLQAFGEDRGFRERHAEFFLRLTEESELMLRKGQEESFWLQRLKTEHDNLRGLSRSRSRPLDQDTGCVWRKLWRHSGTCRNTSPKVAGGSKRRYRRTEEKPRRRGPRRCGTSPGSPTSRATSNSRRGSARKAGGSKAWRTSGMPMGSTSRPPCGRYSVR